MLQPTARATLTKRSLPMSRAFLASRQFQTSTRSAEKEDAAFSPDKTRPEEQKQAAAEEMNKHANSATTPQDGPGNPKAGQPRDPQEGGSQGSKPEEGSGGSSRSGPSGGGSPSKAGGGKSGGGGGA